MASPVFIELISEIKDVNDLQLEKKNEPSIMLFVSKFAKKSSDEENEGEDVDMKA